MKKKVFISFFLAIISIILVSCSGEQIAETIEVTRISEITQEVTREVEITVEVTKIITKEINVPVTVTPTPGPSLTPTATDTPTITPTSTLTPTFTPSPTPFKVYGCQNLRSVTNYWNIDKENYPERMYPTYDALDGKCVKFYGSENLGVIATDMGWLSLTHLDFNLTEDDKTPDDIEIKTYSTIWGVWEKEGEGEYKIRIRRVDPFTNLQQPIEDDGFYLVGEKGDIGAGRIKSLWPPGTIDNCYWARTNPDTGGIKANHFGQAGVYTTIYEGDLFETSDCTPWVYFP